MPSTYPGALDSLSNPTTSSQTTNPSHAGQHTDANDALEAIEGELGTDPSGTSATVRARQETIEAAATAHLAAADPHTGYQKESEKGAANGYASLGAGALVPVAQLATGTPDGTKFVRDDGALALPGSGGAFPEIAVATRTAGDLTTTSTTWVDLTGMTVTLTTAAVRCLVTFLCMGKSSADGNNTAFDLVIDDVRQGQTYGLAFSSSAQSGPRGFSFWTPVLTAAAHTIKIQWRVDAGTGTAYASTAVTPLVLQVVETALTT